MALTTRKPTGLPAWPLILLAGGEKCGKSYAAAQASSSELVDRTFWFTFGEDDPDEYAPLGRFEIVQFDGTYRGLIQAMDDAEKEPVKDKPHLWVLDSGTKLWDLLSDEAQESANRRAIAKARKFNQTAPDGDMTIGPDLWNVAKQRWAHIITTMKDHKGPSIITSRLEQTVVMDGDRPTKDRVWKVKAEKGLPYDVGAVIQLQGYREAYLTGVRSLKYRPEPGEVKPFQDFTIEALWKLLGIGEATDRSHHAATAQASLAADEQLVARRAELLATLGHLPPDQRIDIAKKWQATHGHPITDTTDISALEAIVAVLETAGQEALIGEK